MLFRSTVILFLDPLRIKYLLEAWALTQHYVPLPCTVSSFITWSVNAQVKIKLHSVGCSGALVAGGYDLRKVELMDARDSFNLPSWSAMVVRAAPQVSKTAAVPSSHKKRKIQAPVATQRVSKFV